MNRLNRTVSIKAEMQIEKHRELYWSLWNCFAHALDHVFAIEHGRLLSYLEVASIGEMIE